MSQGGRSAWAFDLVNFDGRLVAATVAKTRKKRRPKVVPDPSLP